MKPAIYDQHDAAFRSVSAYVIVRNRDRIATIAIKYPRDGAGRLYAYVHFLGMPMVRGFAGGYGYDKRTAAVEDAMAKIDPDYFTGPEWYGSNKEKDKRDCSRFRNAVLKARDGIDWQDALTAAGYKVFQAV